ncbi:fibrinogen-like protein 1 [Zophobas morio]|uniref:fibrinogen-like protein 1 n=1 Tax=Zophobas morio TaxID=2755281 RepID=UPI003082DFA8
MDLKLLLITALWTLCVKSQQNDDQLTEVANLKFEIRETLVETKNRLEKFELKMTQVQRYLDKLLALHEVITEEDFSEPVEPNDLAKIAQVVEKTIVSDKSCEIEELERLKDDLISAIDRNTLSTDVVDNGKRRRKQVIQENEALIVLPDDEEFVEGCKDLFDQGSVNSGLYIIQPSRAREPFTVLCDMDTQGGGWVHFMRRFNGSQNFYLNWTDYRNGFGELDREFWLGLEHLYEFTGDVPKELLFVFIYENKTDYSHFKKFSIGSEGESYAVRSVENYSEDGEQTVTTDLNWKFSTLDRQGVYGSCAKTYRGPWWYGPRCFFFELTYSNFHEFKAGLKEVKMLVKA